MAWDFPAGADRAFVEGRDLTSGGEWEPIVGPVDEDHWDLANLTFYHQYALRVQVAKGTAVARDIYSAIITVSVVPPRVPRLTVRRISHGLVVTWPGIPSAQGYIVRWRLRGHDVAWNTAVVPQASVTVPCPDAGHPYRVEVAGLFFSVAGPATTAKGVPAGPFVSAPAVVVATRATGTAVRLSWSKTWGATRYRVWRRTAHGWDVLGWTRRTRYLANDLPHPRRAHFRVQAMHDHVPGGRSHVAHVT